MAPKQTKSEVPEEVVAAARAAADRKDSEAAALPQELDVAKATKEANFVGFGSEQHERLLSAGFDGLTREMAEQIIKERDQDPHLWPYERYEQAKRFLGILDSEPGTTTDKPHWVRDQV